jgi:Molybdopterin-binding domain of aldehyde dehydrogenase
MGGGTNSDAARVHDDAPGNVAARVNRRKGDYETARQAAAMVLRRRFRYDRGCSAPIETRGVVADWDAKAERLTVWDTTQAPVVIRNGLAAHAGAVRAPGAGSGAVHRRRLRPQDHSVLSREVLLPWLAIQFERPVKWIEDRAEHFLATTQARFPIVAGDSPRQRRQPLPGHSRTRDRSTAQRLAAPLSCSLRRHQCRFLISGNAPVGSWLATPYPAHTVIWRTRRSSVGPAFARAVREAGAQSGILTQIDSGTFGV